MTQNNSSVRYASEKSTLHLGLRANWQPFVLLLIVNAFVGAMVGLERTVVPLIASEEFGIVSKTVTLSFIISFGIVKALTNLTAGAFADRYGRKPLLVAGWLIGLPIPLLIIFAPSWNWIVLANILLGINQGLCWSTTVVMKIDLVGPKQRGLALGLNEFSGYVAVSLSALATGYIASIYSLRPHPFYLGIAFALLGLILSVFFVSETHDHAKKEADLIPQKEQKEEKQQKGLSFRQVMALTSWKDRTLFAVSQAGLVNNLNDGMVWGILPLYLLNRGLPLQQVGIVAATYPAVWGLGQLVTGALSDRWGRK